MEALRAWGGGGGGGARAVHLRMGGVPVLVLSRLLGGQLPPLASRGPSVLCVGMRVSAVVVVAGGGEHCLRGLSLPTRALARGVALPAPASPRCLLNVVQACSQSAVRNAGGARVRAQVSGPPRSTGQRS